MRNLYYLTAVLFLNACNTNKVEITSDYILNENWTSQGNWLEVARMRMQNTGSIDLSNLNQGMLLRSLVKDTSFVYVSNLRLNKGETYRTKKFYFNRDNGFAWFAENRNNSTKRIGNLEKGKWYRFSGISTDPYEIYVYIDSLGQAIRYDITLSNY